MRQMDGTSPSDTNRDAVAEMAARIAPYVRRTPSLAVSAADLGLTGGAVVFKLEHLQHAATHKARLAIAGVMQSAARERGPRCRVTVAGAGNAAVAVAWAAARLGCRARVFLPGGTAQPRVARIRGYGAEIAMPGPGESDAGARVEAWAAASGAHVVRCDDRAALLANATIAAEFVADAHAPDTILVPVGSGALIAGMACGAGKGVRLVGVEPVRAPTLHRALKAGCPVAVETSGIAAETLGAVAVSERVFGLLRGRVEQVVLVTDLALIEAQRTLWAALRQSVEPAAAAGLAALQSGSYAPEPGERVGIVLTGAVV